MSTPLKLSTKIGILVAFAVLFAASLVALSVRETGEQVSGSLDWNFDSESGSKKIEKSFTVQPGGLLTLDADGANVSIAGSGTSEVRVTVEIRGPKDKVEKYNVKFNQDGNDVVVDGNQERGFFNWNFFEGSFELHYDVYVPSEYNIRTSTSGGNITIKGVTGEVNGETSGGNLDIELVRGRVRLSTSGGDVTSRDITGDIDLKTSGGNIDAENIAGALNVETSGGNIHLFNVDGSIVGSTSGGNINVSAVENKGMDLETSGGNVKVVVPSTIAATIDAETSGGDVECELDFSGRIKDGTMNGKINGGGNVMRLRASGGYILITTRD
jgi:hypothetical protein